MPKKDLISILDLTPKEIEALLVDAARLKKTARQAPKLAGKTIALIFEKPSTRTVVSFAAGIHALGGLPLILQSEALQWKRGETVPDMARVLSRYVHGMVIRARRHSDVQSFAKYSGVPVINGLTDSEHPCQVLADLLTLWERNGRKLSALRKLRIVFLGDSNNVSYSWMLIAGMIGLKFVLACPSGYEPDAEVLRVSRDMAQKSGGQIDVVHDAESAARGADVLYTDVWTSMGQESEELRRRQAFQAFQLNAQLVAIAKPSVVILHCLPARRGEEITDDVMEGPRSIIFDQAENRLHVQKAILLSLVGNLAKRRS